MKKIATAAAIVLLAACGTDDDTEEKWDLVPVEEQIEFCMAMELAYEFVTDEEQLAEWLELTPEEAELATDFYENECN